MPRSLFEQGVKTWWGFFEREEGEYTSDIFDQSGCKEAYLVVSVGLSHGAQDNDATAHLVLEHSDVLVSGYTQVLDLKTFTIDDVNLPFTWLFRFDDGRTGLKRFIRTKVTIAVTALAVEGFPISCVWVAGGVQYRDKQDDWLVASY